MLARNNVIVKLVRDYPADALTEQEVADLQARIPYKIYEPVMAAGEIVTTVAGDIVLNWGGDYAS